MGMAEIVAWDEQLMSAPADVVYRILADYKTHHPKILPESFSNFKVVEGGIGAGTVATFDIEAGGRTRSMRIEVSEPEPGRVMVEKDLTSSAVTTFTVTPQGEDSSVRIETRWQSAGGIGGFFERLFAPRALRKIYEDELSLLNKYAREQAKA
jgi:hypothetical protein